MKMRNYLVVVMLFCFGLLNAQQLAEGLTTYQLPNGLTVMLWEDHEASDVYGEVVVRAGSIDEPKEYTGLAHYLEHVLFKGTQTIGALDWEKEKPIYDSIVDLYDKFSDSTDPGEREALTQQINELSIRASKYGATDDFSNLVEAIGGTGLNATTAYDRTNYFNSFPASQMERWLKLYSDRLINPVFRAFQAELENVFEEYNMGQDDINEFQRDFMFEKLYAGHPYERSIIGTAEHLKNPRMSRLIDFFNTWYVPNNMALLLVGNFNSEEVKPLIETYFGRFEEKPLPERVSWTETSFEGNPKFEKKVGYGPSVIWGYKGVKVGDPDELPLEMAVALLNNSANTGLLDKLMLDGTVGQAYAYVDSRRDMGRIIISATPYYDPNQRSYEPNSTTEKIVMKEVNKLKNGEIEPWLIESVRKNMLQELDQMLESQDAKAAILHHSFIYQQPLEQILNQKEQIEKMTKEEIMTVAQKYFNQNHMTFAFEEGKPKKTKLPKPKIKPLTPPTDVKSAYFANFEKDTPAGLTEERFCDLNDVDRRQVDEQVNLYVTKNPHNKIFSLVLRYGVGTEKKPLLGYAVELMNTAGVLPQKDAQQFRRELSELGGTCSYSVSGSYLYVVIEGDEDNLEKILQSVNRQILMPKLDQRQLEAVQGSSIMMRLFEREIDSYQTSALINYILYKDESRYIKRPTISDLLGLTIPKLISTFQDATMYNLEIHYVGQRSTDDVADVMRKNFLKEGMRPSKSPVEKNPVKYDKTQVYFMPNSEIQQAQIYFYVDGKPYNVEEDVLYEAFNQYFSGGFSGLVMNEIREKRSLAYTAYGQVATPEIPGNESYLIGYVGCQPDKTFDAVDTYMQLLLDMPMREQRIDHIKQYLKQVALTSRPSFRSRSMVYSEWNRLGFKDDPSKEEVKKIDALTFDDIKNFYEANIKGKPITVVIIGDPKKIDQKAIQAKYGKMKKVSKTSIFSPLDFD